MLRPIKSPIKTRRFLTYDFEWYPKTLQLRVCGLFDGERYQHFFSPKDFLNEVLRPFYSGAWFYAHAGGLYDFQFLLEELIASGWQVEAATSGSSAIIVKVTNGDHHWYFIDSYWLMRQPLAKIAKMVGMSKGDCAFDAPLTELIPYNELDCRILWVAIAQFEEFLNGLGGQLEKTIASCALGLFKRSYLTRELSVPDTVNLFARQAYTGSRVEPFYVGQVARGSDWDINSSFPSSMRKPQPGNYVGKLAKRIPKRGKYIVECRVTVPDMAVPPLPYRANGDGRPFFPVGTWDTTLNDVDFQLAELTNCKIERLGRVAVFDTFDDLGAYAEDIYARRKRALSEAEKYILKILLNSLYGKFGERPEKEKLMLNPSAKWLRAVQLEDRERAKRGEPSLLRMMAPGLFAYTQSIPVPHEHVAISANITADARATLYDYLVQCALLYYCDTDGFCCCHKQSFPTSDELGGLKKVKEWRPWTDPETGEIHPGAMFLASKLYALHDDKWDIKAKGFSKVHVEGSDRSRPMTYAEFVGLLQHKEIPLETFSRIRGTLKGGLQAGITTKTWRGTSRPKRKQINTKGNTVPWTVEELNG